MALAGYAVATVLSVTFLKLKTEDPIVFVYLIELNLIGSFSITEKAPNLSEPSRLEPSDA